MERIEIEVDYDTALKWHSSSQRRREKAANLINLILTKELSDTPEEFLQFLNETRQKMNERGLTEEILQEILNND